MFGFVSAKAHKAVKYDLLALREQLEETETSLYSWKRAAEAAKADLNMWRQKFELSQLTPEVKADTEAAFKRGAQFTKTLMLNNLREMMINTNVEVSEEENA
jgi:F0F1-type ATP synthase alpha subunit